MVTILYVWTVVAAAGSQTTTYQWRDWRWFGEYSSSATCSEAARQLNIDAKVFRCVSSGKP